MTYCVGMLLAEGLLFASDSLTNAGVDQIAKYRKMHVWESPGEYVFVMMTAGNLAISQAVVTALDEGVPTPRGGEPGKSLRDMPSMTAAARLVGEAVRAVERIDGGSLKSHGVDFDVSVLFGGQVRGGQLRMYQIYAPGNFIESSAETPYFQIGENKYGKPILDRTMTFNAPLAEAAKCALISIDSTLRSNISVGLPVDLVIVKRDGFCVAAREVLEEDDPYFTEVRQSWSLGLRQLFGKIPNPPWSGA